MNKEVNRRDYLKLALTGAATSLVSSAYADPTLAIRSGKAEHCIFFWLGGGMAQVDTFDPKRLGDAKSKPSQSGSYYASIETTVPGVRVTEHLAQTAKLMDHVTAVRTVNHRVVDEHAFATNLVHTGRTISGSTVYPSIGSIVAHQRGAVDPSVPPYMLIGILTDTKTGPAGFTRPADVDTARSTDRLALLGPLQNRFPANSTLADYRAAQVEALRLSGPDFMQHFQLGQEPDSVRQRYGGEFGQRCLLARRLVQAGVRFIEVSHNLGFINGTGWDTHNGGQLQQHLLQHHQ